jgi:hypothetical protein
MPKQRPNIKSLRVKRRNVRRKTFKQRSNADFKAKQYAKQLENIARLIQLLNGEVPDHDAQLPVDEVERVGTAVLQLTNKWAEIKDLFAFQIALLRRYVAQGCQAIVPRQRLLIVLIGFILTFSAQYPMHAAPLEMTYFDSAAGLLATMGTLGSFASLPEAAILTHCSVASKAIGSALRMHNASHPLSTNERLAEGLRLGEYIPGSVGSALYYGKIPFALGAAAHSYATTPNATLRGFVGNAKTLAMKAAPNAAMAIGERYGYSPSESLQPAKYAATAASIF